MQRLRAWMTLTLTALLTAGALAASDISVTVDGRALTFDQPPLMQDGRVLVPLRGIFEALGAEVQWEAATRTVRARSQKSQMVLPLGSRTATVDGRTVNLDVPASVVGGRTVVPLRFVAEAGMRKDGPHGTTGFSGRHAVRALPARRSSRVRRHGRGVPGVRHGARPRGGGEAAA